VHSVVFVMEPSYIDRKPSLIRTRELLSVAKFVGLAQNFLLMAIEPLQNITMRSGVKVQLFQHGGC
jgi:hypothetical protein